MLLWQLLAGVPYIIAFASRSKKKYDVAEASLQISWCFYVAALETWVFRYAAYT